MNQSLPSRPPRNESLLGIMVNGISPHHWIRVAYGLQKVVGTGLSQRLREIGLNERDVLPQAIFQPSTHHRPQRRPETEQLNSNTESVQSKTPSLPINVPPPPQQQQQQRTSNISNSEGESPLPPEQPSTTTRKQEPNDTDSVVTNISSNSVPEMRTDSLDQHSEQSQSAVPSSRVGRAAGFASLGAKLLLNSVAWGGESSNADILAATLCRMRGAALKLGQMLSIQDETLMPPGLTAAMAKVRQAAHVMPTEQLYSQLATQLGEDWRDKFVDFATTPVAAASIGQVHRATIRQADDPQQLQQVVVKVQYPGVADSIVSDLRNVAMLFKWTAPSGLFLDNILQAAASELRAECDYTLEASYQERMRALVHADPYLYDSMQWRVPRTVSHLCRDQVLVSAYCPGGTIDRGLAYMDVSERNRIGRAILYLTMKEIFDWRLLQSDPNWGNFLYDVGTRQTSLIDFGATREYSKEFVDGHLRMVWASANRDEATLLEQSHRMNFLTGQENTEMVQAHLQSGYTMGEPFHEDTPFDFKGSQISSRMSKHMSVFLRHRLTAPPVEVYTLHRKIAGAFMLCIKIGAVVSCRDILRDIVERHEFTDGMPAPSLMK